MSRISQHASGRKEGDKYAADFDETAHFLEQYCACLSKQAAVRTDWIRKVNTTMFQMETTEEAVTNQDKVCHKIRNLGDSS